MLVSFKMVDNSDWGSFLGVYPVKWVMTVARSISARSPGVGPIAALFEARFSWETKGALS